MVGSSRTPSQRTWGEPHSAERSSAAGGHRAMPALLVSRVGQLPGDFLESFRKQRHSTDPRPSHSPRPPPGWQGLILKTMSGCVCAQPDRLRAARAAAAGVAGDGAGAAASGGLRLALPRGFFASRPASARPTLLRPKLTPLGAAGTRTQVFRLQVQPSLHPLSLSCSLPGGDCSPCHPCRTLTTTEWDNGDAL